LYELGLARVVARCFRENPASERMLSSCMRRTGEDERFSYFAKEI
jgi:RimJ/RimL family protein N-acetyltransferase